MALAEATPQFLTLSGILHSRPAFKARMRDLRPRTAEMRDRSMYSHFVSTLDVSVDNRFPGPHTPTTKSCHVR
jgi:hypothetical protein